MSKIKICTKCSSEKNETEFHWRCRDQNLRASWCKICISLETKKRFKENPDYFNDKNRQRREKNREKISDLKNKPCVDCERTFPPICMDFDHVSGIKLGDVSAMVNDVGIETLLAEIAKCELVCACCHRIRTHKRLLNK